MESSPEHAVSPVADNSMADTENDTSNMDTSGTGSSHPCPEATSPSTPRDCSGAAGGDDEVGRGSAEVSDDDSVSSDSSNISDVSGLNWKSTAGSICWVQEQIGEGVDPRDVLRSIRPGVTHIPAHIDDITLWKVIIDILSEPPRRERLRHVSVLEDVVRLIRASSNTLVLTGAGVSVSCGIPDFRSRDGIYARLAVDFPDLPDPQAMFDIKYFRKDPRPFFKFAKEIYPGQFTPSLCHRFIAMLERQNKLLRNYTQNIDTLEQAAGITRVIQCHGSFATASCLCCGHRVDSEQIRPAIINQELPLCPRCSPPSSPAQHDDGDSNMSVCRENLPIMKPDIVFFGEGLSDEFHNSMEEDAGRCDLLIIIGSSLKVRPVALIPSSIKSSVAQVLINREPLSHITCDVELLGDCDVIVDHLCRQLGGPFSELCSRDPLRQIDELPTNPAPTSSSSTPNISADTPSAASDPAAVRDPVNENDLDALRSCWQRKVRASVADCLPENSYLYKRPCRYIFSGAEVYFDPDDVSADDSDSSSSHSPSDVTEDQLTLKAEGEETHSSPASDSDSRRRSCSESRDQVPGSRDESRELPSDTEQKRPRTDSSV